mgnify:CR=1 FL=1
MGKSDPILFEIYKKAVLSFKSPIALLGFTQNSIIEGDKDLDLYDLSTGWDINSDWRLYRTYKSIIVIKNPNKNAGVKGIPCLIKTFPP